MISVPGKSHGRTLTGFVYKAGEFSGLNVKILFDPAPDHVKGAIHNKRKVVGRDLGIQDLGHRCLDTLSHQTYKGILEIFGPGLAEQDAEGFFV